MNAIAENLTPSPPHKGHFSTNIPFLQNVWDSTTLGCLKTCPRKYQLTFVQDLVPNVSSPHLDFGLLLHKGREIYYRAIVAGLSHNGALVTCLRKVIELSGRYVEEAQASPENLLDQVVGSALPADGSAAPRVWQPWRSGHKLKDLYHCLLALTWYLDHYQHDSFTTFILADGKPAVELSFKLGLGFPDPSGVEYFISGHIDRVATCDDLHWLSDLKSSTAPLNDNYFSQFNPSNQMTLYQLAGQAIFGFAIQGMMIDAVQVLANGVNLQRGFIHRTQDQLQAWLGELKLWIAQAELYAKSGIWPMNDTACSHYGGCAYQPICAAPKSQQEAQRKLHYVKRVWDPTVNR